MNPSCSLMIRLAGIHYFYHGSPRLIFCSLSLAASCLNSELVHPLPGDADVLVLIEGMEADPKSEADGERDLFLDRFAVMHLVVDQHHRGQDGVGPGAAIQLTEDGPFLVQVLDRGCGRRDGGWSLDLSEPIMWRSLFHCDNAYRLPAVDLTGRVCRTHKTSQTAFRGFGGPQGMFAIEYVLDDVAVLTGALSAANQNEWIAFIKKRLAEKQGSCQPGLPVQNLIPPFDMVTMLSSE